MHTYASNVRVNAKEFERVRVRVNAEKTCGKFGRLDGRNSLLSENQMRN